MGGLWHSELVAWKDGPHAPRELVVAAAELDAMGMAYVFTQHTYHVLQVPNLVWSAHGSMSALFAEVPVGTITCGYGVAWPDEDGTIYVTSGSHYWQYTVDRTTGRVSFFGGDEVPWDLGEPHVPDPTRLVAMWANLANSGDWAPGDPSQICGGSHTEVGPYVAVLTSLHRVHIYEARDCWEWYADLPYASYGPFGAAGAPRGDEVTAAFHMGAVFYVFARR